MASKLIPGGANVQEDMRKSDEAITEQGGVGTPFTQIRQSLAGETKRTPLAVPDLYVLNKQALANEAAMKAKADQAKEPSPEKSPQAFLDAQSSLPSVKSPSSLDPSVPLFVVTPGTGALSKGKGPAIRQGSESAHSVTSSDHQVAEDSLGDESDDGDDLLLRAVHTGLASKVEGKRVSGAAGTSAFSNTQFSPSTKKGAEQSVSKTLGLKSSTKGSMEERVTSLEELVKKLVDEVASLRAENAGLEARMIREINQKTKRVGGPGPSTVSRQVTVLTSDVPLAAPALIHTPTGLSSEPSIPAGMTPAAYRRYLSRQ